MDKLVKRLSSILTALEDVGSIHMSPFGNKIMGTISPEILIELKSLIQDITASKCSNGDFCGMEKKW